ncbi:tRNA lysidine(34) synthetase TilS [Bifidobacterium xylocopae]|uniref:tRNA(Ile)-lysidine synthase n=1 Tax=Bifidobacterium xylocopae TaxID=2493119 RepID=A0A366KF06_9BIFI|nr:tRNA lysidine(34) synthetase TilS [Bifidobacterium xylocopae]RBP99812.1 tRNA lysidine(34) synthetase TilS [Bifidobacterium xylocopae]
MVYAAQIKQGIGALRTSLEEAGLGRQSERFARHGEHAPAPGAPLVLVACSGGRDSTALAALASIVCPSLGLRCGAVIIDHDLQEGSGLVAAEAGKRCEDLGLDPVMVRRIRVGRTRAKLEADAREARYAALTKAAMEAGAAAILLAHTRDDLAEGVLIGLIRSSGVGALAGMQAAFRRQGVLYLRPMLDLGREQTTAICRLLKLNWWDDPTNGDDVPADRALPSHYPLRSRIRHDLLPAFSDLAGRDMSDRLARSAQLARTDEDYLCAQADQLLARVRREPLERERNEGVLVRIDARLLAAAPASLRYRAWARVLTDLGAQVSSRQIVSLDALAGDWHGQRGPVLSGGFSADRQRHVILICKDGDHAHR